MCCVILNALNVAEPVWAIPRPTREGLLLSPPEDRVPTNWRPADESGISLKVQAEGELIVNDGVRVCSLWWWNEAMGHGRRLGTYFSPINIVMEHAKLATVSFSGQQKRRFSRGVCIGKVVAYNMHPNTHGL
jgi:hypothetical protein